MTDTYMYKYLHIYTGEYKYRQEYLVIVLANIIIYEFKDNW